MFVGCRGVNLWGRNSVYSEGVNKAHSVSKTFSETEITSICYSWENLGCKKLTWMQKLSILFNNLNEKC